MSNKSSISPADVHDISEQIFSVLASADDGDYGALLELVESRDQLIQSLLPTLDEQQKKQFVESELPVNERIQQQVAALFEQAEGQLSKFVRDQKSVKKYKK